MQKAFKNLLWFSEIFPKKYWADFEKELQSKGSIKAGTKQKTKKNIRDLNKKNSRDKKIRLLIRFSGTESLIRLLVEGQDLKIVQQKAKNLELEIRNIIGQ